jgi:hypothetical protein
VSRRLDELAFVQRSLRFPALEKSVLLALLGRCDGDLTCFPGCELLAADVGVSERAVRLTIPKLVARGLVVSERRTLGNGKSTSNRYRLHLSGMNDVHPSRDERASALPPSGVNYVPGEGEPGSGLGVNDVPRRGERRSDEEIQLRDPDQEIQPEPNPACAEAPACAHEGPTQESPEAGASGGAPAPALTAPSTDSSGGSQADARHPEPLPAANDFAALGLLPRAVGAFGLEVGAWVAGVRSITGQPLTPPRGTPAARLREAIETHCPAGEDRCQFAQRRGAEWARTSPRVISAFKFIEYLDTGSVRPEVRPTRAVQPFNPNSPWLQPRGSSDAGSLFAPPSVEDVVAALDAEAPRVAATSDPGLRAGLRGRVSSRPVQPVDPNAPWRRNGRTA